MIHRNRAAGCGFQPHPCPLIAAHTFRALLAGRQVTPFRSPLAEVDAAAHHFKLVGQTIADVESRGKHLLVHFSSGASLHTHQRMTGSWHVYRHGSRWRKDPRAARAVIETEDAVAVCFSAPLVEIFPPGSRNAHPQLARLEPDLLSPIFDEEKALRRLRARPEMEIGVALMDQTALAGIGNVYKSEVLFVCGLDPFLPVSRLSEAVLCRIVRTTRVVLHRNLGPGIRRTRPLTAYQRLWVYGRSGNSCACCGEVQLRAQGEQARNTYWCPQ